MSRPAQVARLLLLSLALVGCAPPRLSTLPLPPDPTVSPGVESTTPSTGATQPLPTATDVAVLDGVPTSCWSLELDDCRRVVAAIEFQLTAADPPVTYIQVGAFGCDTGERCPRTLAARSQGENVLEAGDGVIGFHVTATEGGTKLKVERQQAFWIQVPPSSRPPIVVGAQQFQLGHCGLWSGIDVGGAWWHPVGPIDGDHPDSINGAQGTINIVDLDHGTFVSRGGLTVQLLRAPGPVSLPPCM
jgi:hypothetical protein